MDQEKLRIWAFFTQYFSEKLLTFSAKKLHHAFERVANASVFRLKSKSGAYAGAHCIGSKEFPLKT